MLKHATDTQRFAMIYNAVCGLSIAAEHSADERASYLERAKQLMTELVAEGKFQDATARQHALADADLQSLRDYTNLQELLDRSPAPPAAD
jgi:hypothetical protein